MTKALKVRELDGKTVAKKEEIEKLRGNVVILNPTDSEIAKHLEIKDKGIYGIRFK